MLSLHRFRILGAATLSAMLAAACNRGAQPASSPPAPAPVPAAGPPAAGEHAGHPGTDDHAGHGAAAADPHAGHAGMGHAPAVPAAAGDMTRGYRAAVTATPAEPRAGAPAQLSLELLDPAGARVTRLAVVHEKVVPVR